MLSTMRRGVVLLVVAALLACLVPAAAAGEEYKGTGPSEALREALEKEAQKAAREQQEANERAAGAKSQQEAKEREAKAAEEQQLAQERQHREEVEREQKTKQALRRCLVPSLKGDSLKRATAALEKNHCRLGKVGAPGHRGPALVVTAQKLKPGSRLPAGTAVGVTLGRPKR
jgi:beta-lactam-binding protein with PASTA domain